MLKKGLKSIFSLFMAALLMSSVCALSVSAYDYENDPKIHESLYDFMENGSGAKLVGVVYSSSWFEMTSLNERKAEGERRAAEIRRAVAAGETIEPKSNASMWRDLHPEFYVGFDERINKGDLKPEEMEHNDNYTTWDEVALENAVMSDLDYELTACEAYRILRSSGFSDQVIKQKLVQAAPNAIGVYLTKEEIIRLSENEDVVKIAEREYTLVSPIVDQPNSETDVTKLYNANYALHILRASAGLEKVNFNVDDFDKDGIITSNDAVIVLRRSVGLE